MGAIFTFLIFVLLGFLGTVAWFLEGFAGLWDNIVTTFQGIEFYWITGFCAVALLLAKLWNRFNPWDGTVVPFINICLLAFAIWFGVIPLVNSTRWNDDFKCKNHGHCDIDDKCLSMWIRPLTEYRGMGGIHTWDPPDEFKTGLCARPFRDVELDTDKFYIGKAEFTQGNYKTWLARMAMEKCDSLKGERKQARCRKGIPDVVKAGFEATIAPDHCIFQETDGARETTLLKNDDAPMVCLSREEAAKVCSSLGGRLPTADDYAWMLDEREFSCSNTVMSGLDEFHGMNRVLKKRQIDAMTPGPGCGTGKFHRVCEKARHGNTGDGLCDVWGNVAEWAGDTGIWGGDYRSTDATIRNSDDQTTGTAWIGFRCIVPSELINQ